MATNEMVGRLLSELQKFSEHIDGLWKGVQLCMAYQTASSPNPHAWTVCVCADELDEVSERTGIGMVIDQLHEQLDPELLSMIERVTNLHDYEPEKDELLADIRTPEDNRLLIGRSIFGREIVRAHIFIFRPHHLSYGSARPSVRAS